MAAKKIDLDALRAQASQEVDPIKQYKDKTAANREFYDSVVANKANWKHLSKHLQPTYTGHPYFVPAGDRQRHVSHLLAVGVTP